MMNNALVLHLSDSVRQPAGARGRQTTRAGRSTEPIGWRSAACPSPMSERQRCSVVERAGLPALARAIFNCNEFLYFD